MPLGKRSQVHAPIDCVRAEQPTEEELRPRKSQTPNWRCVELYVVLNEKPSEMTSPCSIQVSVRSYVHSPRCGVDALSVMIRSRRHATNGRTWAAESSKS